MMTDQDIFEMIINDIFDKLDDIQWKLQTLKEFYNPDSCLPNDLDTLSNEELSGILDNLEDAEKCIDKFKERFAEGEMLW